MRIHPKSWKGWPFQGALMTTVMLILLDIVEPQPTCHFPEFLQSSSFEGIKKTWTTAKWWVNLRHTFSWQEKKEIYVKKGVIVRHREVNKDCKKIRRHAYKASFGSCAERTHVYNQTCISKEGANTYRIIQLNNDGTHLFTCLKFVKRSDNVVQVYEGRKSVTNDSDLCDRNAQFKLDMYPWIAPRNTAASNCPVSGGFRFRTLRRLFNEDLCEHEWRWSTLEVECLRGDGLVFMAPKNSSCNPFLKKGDNKKLLCWAGWKTEDFIFMVASDEGKQPSYCLRFPRVQQGKFSVMVYFSVICPTEPDGIPPAGIEYYELKMHRKDPEHCRDDNREKCQQITNLLETCTRNQTIYPHCAKTCRQCASTMMGDVRHRRCAFNPNLKSNWLLYDKVGVHQVKIDTHEVSMSQLATFHCLSEEMKDNQTVYKTASLFANGCSPRYTCLQFVRNNNNVLHYRIGPSHREELKTDDLCVFKSDPPPLRDSIRSSYMKNLIYNGKIWSSYCGIDGTIAFNGTINGRPCQGTVSDWDETTCTRRGIMTLSSDTCHQLVLNKEFQCLGFIYNETIPLRRLLLTRGTDGSLAFNCWVITSFFDQAKWPKPLMYQLPSTQCSLLMEVQKADYSISPINVYLDWGLLLKLVILNDSGFSSAKRMDCKPKDTVINSNKHHHNTQMEMTKSNNVTYIVPHKPPSTDKHQEIHIKPDPHKANSKTDSPYQPLHGNTACIPTHNRCYLIFSSVVTLVHYFIFFMRPGS